MKLSLADEKVEKEFHVSWWIIAYKGLFGLTEFISGFGLSFFGKKLLNIYTIDIAKELSEDPHDLLANISQKIIPGLLSHNLIIAIYLLLLGGVKIAGSIGLIYKKNWGVDLLVGLTMILLPFQLADLFINPSIFSLFYLLAGLLIALYLVEFKPKAWISKKLQTIYQRIK